MGPVPNLERDGVYIVTDGSLVCVVNSKLNQYRNCTNCQHWFNNCATCDKWRLIVWKNGAHEHPEDKRYKDRYNGKNLSTEAGKFYGGHDPCTFNGDDFRFCGE